MVVFFGVCLGRMNLVVVIMVRDTSGVCGTSGGR